MDNSLKVDVRIIVSNLNISEVISKAIINANLESYNVIVSSIIPTNDLEIAKKVANGADIILIGDYGESENFSILYNDLKNDFNHVALLNYNNIVNETESFDVKLAEKEIFNAIIKATLSYSLNLIDVHTLESKVVEITRKYNSLLDDYNELVNDNNQSKLEYSQLKKDHENLKIEFDEFKVKYENIYNKDILEVFKIKDLWFELFDERNFDLDRVIEASEMSKPENIIVGQDYIAAESRQSACEWLKIVRTALLFINEI